MLRLRRKPPAGLPTVNSGQPWSELDVSDLRELRREGRSIAEIGEYLCREVEEVEDKAAELGLKDPLRHRMMFR
jgi:hypothetical protein